MRGCFVLPVVLGLSLASLGGVVDDRDSVPFRLRDGSDVVVPVGVAGRGPFRFLLDTGSNRSALTDRLANELRLPAAGLTTVVTAAGRTSRPLLQVTLELGSARSTVSAMILPAGDLGQGIDGLIGSDFLASRRFTIDYRHRRVLPEHGDRLDRGTSVALTHDANGFLITVAARDGTPPLRLIPDTGTASVVLFARADRRLPRISPMSAVPLRAVGRVKVGRAVLLEQLQIGNVEVRDQVAIVMEGSSLDARLGDGLLPLHLFARVTFDGPEGALAVVPYR
jgi:predicted aspartyl protease